MAIRSVFRFIAIVGSGALIALAMAAPLSAAKAEKVNAKDGKWVGTAVDDKYGSIGTVSFKVQKDGRQLRRLQISGLTGDCALGTTATDLGIAIPRAEIRSSGLMKGHYVAGEPGDSVLSVVSYEARFRGGKVTDARIYQNNDINNVGSTCEVPAARFSASRDG